MMHQTSPELPSLDPGITLLETDERMTGSLQSLVLDQLLLEQGSAVWIDAHGHGTTHPLTQITPSMRILDRIHIARAFTPWQHQSLVEDLARELTDETTIAVLPALDCFYRSEDLPRGDDERMLATVAERIDAVAERFEIPVLLTLQTDDTLTAPIHEIADRTIQCERTKFGLRFAGEEYETLVYPLENGLVQTTLAYWKRILANRHPAMVDAGVSPEMSANGAY
ncbi:hypothetical protein A4G99_19365 [Haladaptatus sp. R4]|uniref:hypothetical protein n=1 Tax=Haladaptatus sp. R4 TaxID=1679489 RepID=UPI0007B4F342|nr:hypothetical protein [Haladaptatus sp. R4]KZN22620.1 hypothetical protein A4G99_19365 [Haladaptatus sp. R4]